MISDAERLLSIIMTAPLPSGKTDSELAQEYRNWYYGVRSERLKPAKPTARVPFDADLCLEEGCDDAGRGASSNDSTPKP